MPRSNKRNSRLAVWLGSLIMLAATASTGAASSLAPARTIGADVTHFGGDEFRNHYSGETWGNGMCAAWAVDLGRSSSQPLVVGQTIYHLAGDSLWAIRMDKEVPPGLTPDEIRSELVVWRKPGLQTDRSDSSPVYSDTEATSIEGKRYRGIVYAITGPAPGSNERTLVAVAAEDGTMLGRVPLTATNIVSSPLAFPGDVVVFGSSDGFLYSVKGVTRDHITPAVVSSVPVGGSITSSFVPVGDNGDFLVGIQQLDGEGAVMRYNQRLEPRWETPDGQPDWFLTLTGVPASFAEDADGSVYFSDRLGVFYAMDGETGGLRWFSASTTSTGDLVNNSPAIDQDYAYFTIRRTDTGQGKLVAFDRDAKGLQMPAWSATLPALGTTAPLIWGDAGAILVGTTDGRISAWRAPLAGEPAGIGQPVPFATQLSCSQIGHTPTFWGNIGGSREALLQSELRLTDNPYQDTTWWSQGSGASTELTLANGYLLTGANGRTQDVFLAFRPGKPVNLTLSGQMLPEGPIEPGQQIPVRMHVANYSPQPLRTMIAHGWAATPPSFTFVNLAPGEMRTVWVVTDPAPEGAAQFVAVVNPVGYDLSRRGTHTLLEPLPSLWEPSIYGQTHLAPSVTAGLQALDAAGSAVIYETTMADNYWRRSIETSDPLDLVLTDLTAPAWIPAPEPPEDPRYPVTATIANTGDEAVETSLRLVVNSLSMQGQAITQTVHLEPGQNAVTVWVPGSMPGDTIIVVATVDPDRDVSEIDYTNNERTVTTDVEAASEPPPPPADAGHVDDVLLD